MLKLYANMKVIENKLEINACDVKGDTVIRENIVMWVLITQHTFGLIMWAKLPRYLHPCQPMEPEHIHERIS